MKNQNEIERGDIVTLKSGGPKMTVEGFKFELSTGTFNQREVRCTWFKGEDRFSEYFNALALVKAKK